MAEETKNVDTATEVAEDVDVKVGDTVPEEEPKPDIPEELAGLPEEIAREAMEEAAKATPEDTEDSEDGGSDKESSLAENTDSQKTEKGEYDDILPNQAVPYIRFKQLLDENNKLKQQANQQANQQQINNNQAPMQQPVMAPGNQPLQQTPMQQPVNQAPVITADVTQQIEQAIKMEAMRMTGMSEETIDSMEYMDENDSRRQIWNTAQAMARSEIFRKIEQERQRQIDNSRRIIAAHNENVMAYNKFAQEQMQDPDFEAIKDFATQEYFSSLGKDDDGKILQRAVSEAYARIENNRGSLQDTVLIRRFFTDAKNEYRRTHANGSSKGNIEKKVRQGQAFPRSGEINGSGNDGNVTVDTLAIMLETTPFEQIPEEYQRKLLGYE